MMACFTELGTDTNGYRAAVADSTLPLSLDLVQILQGPRSPFFTSLSLSSYVEPGLGSLHCSIYFRATKIVKSQHSSRGLVRTYEGQ